MFNDPYRTKHKGERVRQETLLNYVSPITSLLEKSYSQRSSFSELHTVIDKLVEAYVKYSDYLSANLQSVKTGREREANTKSNVSNILWNSSLIITRLYP